MWPNRDETANLVTFAKEIPNEKLHFLSSVTGDSTTGYAKWKYLQLH